MSSFSSKLPCKTDNKPRRWVNCWVFKKHNNHLRCSFLSTSPSSHVLQLPSVYVKTRAIDRAWAKRMEMLMVCGSALSELLVGRRVTHPPTPHFPYCTADRVQLKLAVGVILKVRFGVKTYVHYLKVMGFSFVHIYICTCLLSHGCFTFCQHGHRPQKLVQRDKECVSLMRPNRAAPHWQPLNVCSKWQLSMFGCVRISEIVIIKVAG